MAIKVEKYGAQTVNAHIVGGYRQVLKATDEDGNESFYVASNIPSAPDTGQPETLVFASDEEGAITSWADVAGGRFMSIDEAIADLVAVLNGNKERTILDNPGYQAAGDPLSFMLNTLRSIPWRSDDDDEEEVF